MNIFEQLEEMKWQEGVKVGERRGVRKGERIGQEKARKELARDLLANTRLSIAKIAALTHNAVSTVSARSKGIRKK